MFDQILGLVLLGLGLQSPVNGSNVGVPQVQKETVLGSSHDSSDDSDESSGSTGETESTGATGVSSSRPAEQEHTQETERIKGSTGARIEAVKKAALLSKSRTAELKAQWAKKTAEFEAKKRDLQKEMELFKRDKNASRAGVFEHMEEQTASFLDHIEAKREEGKALIEEKKAVFDEKIQLIKNTAKKQTVVQIQEKMTQLNVDRTNKMSTTLTKMSDILKQILEKAAATKTAGKDTSAVDAAVIDAQSAISAAQDFVSSQAAKQYVITISSEANLKTDVGTTRSTLEKDLKTVNDAIVTARKKISTALRALAIARGEPVPEAVIK